MPARCMATSSDMHFLTAARLVGGRACSGALTAACSSFAVGGGAPASAARLRACTMAAMSCSRSFASAAALATSSATVGLAAWVDGVDAF